MKGSGRRRWRRGIWGGNMGGQAAYQAHSAVGQVDRQKYYEREQLYIYSPNCNCEERRSVPCLFVQSVRQWGMINNQRPHEGALHKKTCPLEGAPLALIVGTYLL